MTISLTTLSIMITRITTHGTRIHSKKKHSIMTLGIMMVSKMTLSIMTRYNDRIATLHNDNIHSTMTLRKMTA